MNYQVKGAALSGTKNFFDARMHDGYFAEEAKRLGLNKHGRVLTSEWYEADKAMKMFENAARDLGYDFYELTKVSVQAGMQQDLSGIYRFFMKLGGPERVMAKAPQMASAYANYYTYSMIRNEPGLHEFTVSDVPEALSKWTLHIVEGILKGMLRACDIDMERFRIVSEDTYQKEGKTFRNSLVEVSY